jgi:hypothetical protein
MFSRVIAEDAVEMHVRGRALGYHPITESPFESFIMNIIVHPNDIGSLELRTRPEVVEHVSLGNSFTAFDYF